MSNEYPLPDFPALERCLVIESSFSVRSEVLKSLKASSLFSELKIADSIQDGLIKIQKSDFDACIVGSSVSTERAALFIEKASTESKRKDCAFILLVEKDNSPKKNNTEEIATQPHGKINFPTTKRKFTEEVIKSVVKANNSCLWSSIYADFVLTEKPEEKKAHKDQTKNTSSQSSSLGSQFKILEEILEGINVGIYSIDDDGKPNSRAAWILDNTFEKLFNMTPITKKELDFAAIFRTFLEEWFITSLKGNSDQANTEFKAKLFSYLKINLS